jgi:hypothetical protein
MKVVSTMCTGTYYSPWFPYALASVYNRSDEIIVVNAGHDLKNFKRDVWYIPTQRVTDEIKYLDVNGKIKEIKELSLVDIPFNYPIMTQLEMNNVKDIHNFDVRGIVMTLATRAAYRSGADWVHKIDHDQVMYNDWDKYEGGSYMAYQYEFGYMIQNPTYVTDSEPFNDGTFTYKPYEEDWYQGSGSPALKPGMPDNNRVKSPKFHCAHFRYCQPLICSNEEWIELLYNYLLWRDYNNYVGVFDDALGGEVLNSLVEAVRHYKRDYPKSLQELPSIVNLNTLEDIRRTLL